MSPNNRTFRPAGALAGFCLWSSVRAEGSGLPTFARIGVVAGFTPISAPLSLLLPQGQTGCDLLVPPDFVEFVLPVAGTAQSQITLPFEPTLAGQQFHHPFVPFELDGMLQFVAITATNALTVTIGTL